MTAEKGEGVAVGDLPKLREKLSVSQCLVCRVLDPAFLLFALFCFGSKEEGECCGAYIAMRYDVVMNALMPDA